MNREYKWILLYCQSRISGVDGSSTRSYGPVVEKNLESEGSEEKKIHVSRATG